MAEKFSSLKNLTTREAALIDAPLFFARTSIPSGGDSDQVLVLDNRGRVSRVPRAEFSSTGTGGDYSGSLDLTVSTDSGTLVRTLPEESLSLLGGTNISTSVSGNSSVIILDANINLTSIELQQDVATTDTLVIKNHLGETQVQINQDGVMQLSAKATPPPAVEGGMYYRSGSGVDEAFFIGISD